LGPALLEWSIKWGAGIGAGALNESWPGLYAICKTKEEYILHD
jgi:hypothetical protein